MAASIWSAFLAGLPESDIARMLSHRDGVALSTAGDYVAGALRPLRGEIAEDAPSDALGDERPVPTGRARVAESYRLLDLEIRLGFGSRDLHRRVHPALKWLGAAGAPLERRDWRLCALGGGFALVEKCRIVQRCAAADEVAPMIKAHLVYAALEASRDAVALHAASLGAGDRCLLLPGCSGAGKSTLAAGLASEGFAFLGDDTAVLANGTLRVRPLPLPIALKAGSWHLLGERAPGLLDLPVHWRVDGKSVRYWVPPEAARPALRPMPVEWIVFPVLAPRRASALEPVSAELALKRLIAGLVPLGAGLTPAKVDRLIAGIDRVACFDLRYDSLDDAIRRLEGLCR